MVRLKRTELLITLRDMDCCMNSSPEEQHCPARISADVVFSCFMVVGTGRRSQFPKLAAPPFYSTERRATTVSQNEELLSRDGVCIVEIFGYWSEKRKNYPR